MISVHHAGAAGELGDLSWFRQEFYQCLARRADALFELTDAVLCADGPVTSLVELCLAMEHRRGHGALSDARRVGVAAPSHYIVHRSWDLVALRVRCSRSLCGRLAISAGRRASAGTGP